MPYSWCWARMMYQQKNYWVDDSLIIKKEDIIWEVASKYPITVSTFLKYWAEFCCKWNISLEEASKRDWFDLEKVIYELNSSLKKITDNDKKVAEMESLVDISNYIVKTFHEPIKEMLIPTQVLARKVASVHWDSHEWVKEISEIVDGMVSVLDMHFDKEWQILHPMMAEIDDCNKSWTTLWGLHCWSIQNPIMQMEHEHENYWDMLQELRKLTNNYTLPEWACRSHTALWANLEKLEEDLMRHTNLENFILHPKAIEMEKKVSWKSCSSWFWGWNEFDF